MNAQEIKNHFKITSYFTVTDQMIFTVCILHSLFSHNAEKFKICR